MSHKAVEAKPEKITFAGDMEKSMAKRKKRSAVRCCGMTAVAQRPMVITASAAALDSAGESQEGLHAQKMIPAVMASVDTNNVKLTCRLWCVLIGKSGSRNR